MREGISSFTFGDVSTKQFRTQKETRMLKIGIIIGSTRPGRNGEAVAQWVYEIASQRTDAEYELVDLLDYNLPHLDEALPAGDGPVRPTPHTKTWAAEDRRVRRLRLRDARVQPLDLRRAEERDRLPLRRVEQQGGRLRRLRRGRWRPRRRAPAPRPGELQVATSAPRSASPARPTSRTSASSSRATTRSRRARPPSSTRSRPGRGALAALRDAELSEEVAA